MTETSPSNGSGRVIAIIPARGGSKGLPGKNVKMIGGMPLIGHSVVHALESGVCDRVLVTTDSEEIRAAAANTAPSSRRAPIGSRIWDSWSGRCAVPR